VFVSYENEVFAHGVRGLLRDVPGIELVGVTADAGAAPARARSLLPDVIIIEWSSQGEHPSVRAFFENPSTRRVIMLSLESTVATVYEIRRTPVTQPSLLSAVIGQDELIHIPANTPTIQD
jgi:DNA-binding NarL/FixJ family response regulator